MKTNKLTFILMCTSLFYSCSQNDSNLQIEAWKQEIMQTEQNFEKTVQEQGMHQGFVAFADDHAVLMRNNALIIGKQAIDERYKNFNSKSLSWKPDFIEVSKSGDLGYTYGDYSYTYKDSIGNEQIDKGIFHTVWKRQEDGSWKFVWD